MSGSSDAPAEGLHGHQVTSHPKKTQPTATDASNMYKKLIKGRIWSETKALSFSFGPGSVQEDFYFVI